jgi:hypothetical protein
VFMSNNKQSSNNFCLHERVKHHQTKKNRPTRMLAHSLALIIRVERSITAQTLRVQVHGLVGWMKRGGVESFARLT